MIVRKSSASMSATPAYVCTGVLALVPQAETQRQVSSRLPVVVDEEPVAPAAHVPLNLVGRRNHRPRQPEHEIRHRVPADVTGEIEQSARIVGRSPAGRQPAQVESRTHVVRAAVPGQDVRGLERRVELIPVRAAGRQAAELADVDARNARIVVLRVAVKPGDAERRAGTLLVVDRELIQRVEVETVVADAKIVEQGGLQRVGVGERACSCSPAAASRRCAGIAPIDVLRLSCQL